MGIIIKPIITEKMTAVSEKMPNRYGFIVEKDANKIQIKNAVKEIYGKEVLEISTMIYNGKVKTRNTKSGVISGKSKAVKKAIVTLAKGESIDFYSNI